jgi:hypothetical protein
VTEDEGDANGHQPPAGPEDDEPPEIEWTDVDDIGPSDGLENAPTDEVGIADAELEPYD